MRLAASRLGSRLHLVIARDKTSLEAKMKTATRWVLRSDMTRTSILTVACMATVVLIEAVWPSARLSGAVTKVHAHERGCSIASLNGTYAFRRTGVNNNIAVGGPIAQIGIAHYNGDGTIGSLRTTRSSNGVIRDWTDTPTTGTYTVDSDCTGSLFDLNGTKSNNLIVLGRGKSYLLLSVAPGTITTEEGTRLDVED